MGFLIRIPPLNKNTPPCLFGRRPKILGDFQIFHRFSLFFLGSGSVSRVDLDSKIVFEHWSVMGFFVWRPCGAYWNVFYLFSIVSNSLKKSVSRFTGNITRLYHCRMINKEIFKFQNVGLILKRLKMMSFRVSPPQAPKKIAYFEYLRIKLIRIPPLVCVRLTIRGGILIKNPTDVDLIST